MKLMMRFPKWFVWSLMLLLIVDSGEELLHHSPLYTIKVLFPFELFPFRKLILFLLLYFVLSDNSATFVAGPEQPGFSFFGQVLLGFSQDSLV